MKRLLLILSMLSLFATGCGPIERTADYVFSTPPKSDPQWVVDLAKDKVALQTVLDSPTSSEGEKKIARQLIDANDKIVQSARNAPDGQSWAELAAEVGGMFGLPGAGLLGALALILKRRLQLSNKAVQQTANAIEETRAGDKLPTNLEIALDKHQDADVKALITEVKAGAQ